MIQISRVAGEAIFKGWSCFRWIQPWLAKFADYGPWQETESANGGCSLVSGHLQNYSSELVACSGWLQLLVTCVNRNRNPSLFDPELPDCIVLDFIWHGIQIILVVKVKLCISC